MESISHWQREWLQMKKGPVYVTLTPLTVALLTNEYTREWERRYRLVVAKP